MLKVFLSMRGLRQPINDYFSGFNVFFILLKLG